MAGNAIETRARIGISRSRSRSPKVAFEAGDCAEFQVGVGRVNA